MRFRRIVLVCMMALFGAAGAQEQPVEEKAPVESAAQSPEAEPAEPAPPPARTSERSPDSFTPSEEISEDLSVSFPVDI